MSGLADQPANLVHAEPYVWRHVLYDKGLQAAGVHALRCVDKHARILSWGPRRNSTARSRRPRCSNDCIRRVRKPVSARPLRSASESASVLVGHGGKQAVAVILGEASIAFGARQRDLPAGPDWLSSARASAYGY